MRAFEAVRGWVNAWQVPARVDDPGAGAAGACVTLRLNGELVGRGEAFSLAGGSALLNATRDAMSKAEGRLRVPNDATREDATRRVAAEIAISVELAGPLITIEPKTWGDVDTGLSPGLDGVIVRGGEAEGRMEAVFPSTMLTLNILPRRAIAGAAASLIGEGGAAAALNEPEEIRAKHGLRMQRFRVCQVAQGRAADAPIVLFRGQRLIPANTVMTGAELREMASGLAQHLVKRAEGQVRVDPARGSAGRATDALSGLLSAYALARYHAVCADQVQPGVKDIERAISAAWREYAAVEEPGIPAGSALVWMTVPGDSMLGSDERALQRVRFQQWSRAIFAPELAGRQEAPKALVQLVDPKQITRELRPLVLFAVLSGYQAGTGANPVRGADDAAVLAGTERLIRSLYAEAGESRLVSMMPWLGWSEIAQAEATRADGNAPRPDLAGALALRQMRDDVWKHQLAISDAGEDGLDMIGGIVFTDGKGTPLPTWQSVRPLAFIATMLRDERLTEKHERPREIARLMRAMRFLRQLQVDESECWMISDCGAATGGVRASTWDQTTPTDATSLALLCVVEMLKSLEAIAHEAGGVGGK